MQRILFITLTITCICFANPINDTCVIHPQEESCKNYQLPTSVVEDDISNLCGHMGFMIGCSVKQICAVNEYKTSYPQYCEPFNVLKDLCTDMPKMGGCTNYRSMCNTSSVVEECKQSIPPFPTTKQTQTLISSICNEMTMDGCTKCSDAMNDCDLLTVYSDLCKSMPDMSQCGEWKQFCGVVPNWPICATSGKHGEPIMRMYFHTGIMDYVLFKEWVPRTTGQYVGTWFAVCVMGILGELLKVLRAYLEKIWTKEREKSELQPLNGSSKKKVPAFSLKEDGIRSLLRFLEVGWGLILMLVAMTYNVGLFIAVCVGAMLGTLFFGRYINYDPTSTCCD